MVSSRNIHQIPGVDDDADYIVAGYVGGDDDDEAGAREKNGDVDDDDDLGELLRVAHLSPHWIRP